MLSCNTYGFAWVSLTLFVGYLFTAAPAKHSHCSLPWTRGISSQLPLLTLDVVLLALLHLHSCHSAIKRNAFESVLMSWMNLEPIIQSEVSQKEKDKYILMHIYGI